NKDRSESRDSARNGLGGALQQRRRLRTWDSSVQVNYGHESIPSDRLFVQVNVDLLGFEILFDSQGAKLSSKSRLFVATPRSLYIGRLHMIHPDNTRTNSLHNPKSTENIA